MKVSIIIKTGTKDKPLSSIGAYDKAPQPISKEFDALENLSQNRELAIKNLSKVNSVVAADIDRHIKKIKKYKKRKAFQPLSANPTKWSNTLKQFAGKLPTNCLSVFDHFVGLTLKGLSNSK